MPVRLCALTEKKTSDIFAWILQHELQNANDALATQVNGRTYAVASSPLYDLISGSEIGKFVFTIFSNIKMGRNEILDVDLVLNNTTPTVLAFEKMLPQSSDSNEYYEVITQESEQHLIVETVNRYAVSGNINRTERPVYVSAFPYQLTVFDSIKAYNKFCGFEKPVQVGNLDLTVHGLGTTFACPGNLPDRNPSNDEPPWSFMAGEIKSFKKVKIAFGSILREAYLIILHSALGDLPTLAGTEMFDLNNIETGKVVGMNAYIKANFIMDKYPKV